MTSSSRPEAAGTVLTEITAPDFSEARSCAVETAKPDDDVAERENLPDGELAPGGAAAVEQLDKPACPHAGARARGVATTRGAGQNAAAAQTSAASASERDGMIPALSRRRGRHRG